MGLDFKFSMGENWMWASFQYWIMLNEGSGLPFDSDFDSSLLEVVGVTF